MFTKHLEGLDVPGIIDAPSAVPNRVRQQVVALAAGTLGMPSTVANYSWVRDVLDTEDEG